MEDGSINVEIEKNEEMSCNFFEWEDEAINSAMNNNLATRRKKDKEMEKKG